MFNVIKNGFQSVLMAPTEILARQHDESAKKLFFKYNNASLLLSDQNPTISKFAVFQVILLFVLFQK